MRRMYSLKQLQEIALKKIESTSNLKVFENIVDKDGHSRFIEGENNFVNEITGLTKKQGKWALSGSHLLIVFAFTNAENNAVSSQKIANVNLPEWVVNKIYPLVGNYVIFTSFTGFDSGGSSQTISGSLRKVDSTISIYLDGNLSSVALPRNFRFAFDLLIDNE